jgi:hypothetical protein
VFLLSVLLVTSAASATLGLVAADALPPGPVRRRVVRASVWTLLALGPLIVTVALIVVITGL